MPDTQTLPPIAVTADEAKAMPQATRDAARAMYAKTYPAADIDAVFGAAAPPVTTITAPLVQTPGGTFAPGSGISREQAVSAAKHLLEHGVDADTVLAAAAQHGLKPEDLAIKPAQDAAATQRDAATANSFAPPAAGERYELRYGQEFAAASDTSDLAQLDKDVQGAFAHAGVPKNLAQPLLTALLETGAMYADESMTDAAREMIWKDQGSILRHSVSDLAEHSRLAAIGYNALPKSFRDDLDSSYAGHSAAAQIQLAALGRAIEYRSKK